MTAPARRAVLQGALVVGVLSAAPVVLPSASYAAPDAYARTTTSAVAHLRHDPWSSEKLEAFFCAPVKRSAQFYEDWTKAEALLPYTIKGDVDPAAEARKNAFGDAALNETTRTRMCKDADAYGRALKDILGNAERVTKPECRTTAQMDKCLLDKQQALTDACVREQGDNMPPSDAPKPVASAAPADRRGFGDLSCTGGSFDWTAAPPITMWSVGTRPIEFTGTMELGVCDSHKYPKIHHGKATFTATGNAGCFAGLGGSIKDGTGRGVIVWDTGQQSTFANASWRGSLSTISLSHANITSGFLKGDVTEFTGKSDSNYVTETLGCVFGIDNVSGGLRQISFNTP